MWDITLSLWLICGAAIAAYTLICHRAARISARGGSVKAPGRARRE
jgi:hypothetical protein